METTCIQATNGKTFLVKTLEEKHHDNHPIHLNNLMKISPSGAHKLIAEFRLKGDINAKDIEDTVLRNYSSRVKRHIVMRVKRLMLFKIEDRHDLSHLKLAHHLELVKKINLGSYAYFT